MFVFKDLLLSKNDDHNSQLCLQNILEFIYFHLFYNTNDFNFLMILRFQNLQWFRSFTFDFYEGRFSSARLTSGSSDSASKSFSLSPLILEERSPSNKKLFSYFCAFFLFTFYCTALMWS